MVKWLELELEAGLRHAMTGKISLSAQQWMGTFFERKRYGLCL